MNKIFIRLMTILSVLLLLTLTGCGSNSQNSDTVDETETEVSESDNSSASGDESAKEQNKINVVMEVNGGQKVEMELYPDVAPKTVDNFVNLVNSGFYNGLTFHRVIKDFMIQGGDPTGTGTGGSDQTIEGEFASNGFENDLKHERGVISMARTSDPNSATSQFFIMTEDTPSLDGDYAAFGRVTSGMDQIDKIEAVETDANDKPVENQVIEKIYVVE